MPRRVHLACPYALAAVSLNQQILRRRLGSALSRRADPKKAPTANFLTVPFDWMGDSRTASNPFSEVPYGNGDILRLGVSVMSLEGLEKIPIIHTQSIIVQRLPQLSPLAPSKNQSTKVLSRVKQDPHCLSLILICLSLPADVGKGAQSHHVTQSPP